MWVFGVFVREKRIAEVLITSTVGPGHHMKNENILKCSEPLWGYNQNFILEKRDMGARDVARLVEHLPRMREVLCFISSTEKTRRGGACPLS